MLVQAYEEPNASVPGVHRLERILLTCVQSYGALFLLLDALDDCPENNEAQQNVLDGLERLSQVAPKTKIFVTSREVSSVRESMQMLRAILVSVASRSVNADIRRYVSTQLARDRKLSKMDVSMKNVIEDRISCKADGV